MLAKLLVFHTDKYCWEVFMYVFLFMNYQPGSTGRATRVSRGACWCFYGGAACMLLPPLIYRDWLIDCAAGSFCCLWFHTAHLFLPLPPLWIQACKQMTQCLLCSKPKWSWAQCCFPLKLNSTSWALSWTWNGIKRFSVGFLLSPPPFG